MIGISRPTGVYSEEDRPAVYETYSREPYTAFLHHMDKYEKKHETPLDPTEFDRHCIISGDIFKKAGLDQKDPPDGCVSTDELSHLLQIPYQEASAMIMQGKIYAKTSTPQGSSHGEQPFRVPASAILFHLDMWEQNYDLPRLKAMFNSWMSTRSGKTPTAEQLILSAPGEER